ncbi:MAG TPA: sulfite exporter TauE/SafE family protein [Syntrophorhabdaceae bacterium]|jgi:hypothetical protein
MNWLVGLISGFLGGLLGGLLGVGGGIIMIPLMTWLAKVTQHQAHGTSLVAIAFTASVAAATYLFQGNADWMRAALVAVSAIFTARLGALFAHSLPERRLRRAFGCLIAFASLMLIFKSYVPGPGGPLSPWASAVIFLLIGCATGFLSGMMGVGGGVVMVPLMVMLAGMGQHLAQGTSLLAMVPISISGAFTHYRLGNVRKDIAWGLAAGALAGGFLGAVSAGALPDAYLRVIFAAVGIWMALRYLRS